MNLNKINLDTYRRFKIVIVGLGGTGSHLVSSLCQLVNSSAALKKTIDLVLIDGDIVEPKNLRNQKFLPEDIGKSKAVALYERYRDVYPEISLQYLDKYIEDSKTLVEILFPRDSAGYQMYHTLSILVGCVDNLKARKLFDKAFSTYKRELSLLYIDTGNGIGESLTGQTALGYCQSSEVKEPTELPYRYKLVEQREVILPPPSFYFPEILTGEDDPEELTCGDTDETNVQNLGANIMSACNLFNIINNILCFKRIPGQMFLFDAKENTLNKAI